MPRVKAFLLLLMLFPVLACCADKAPNIPPTPLPPTPTPIPVTSTALFNEYKANEVGADVKYTGKLAAISGQVALVERDGSDVDVKLVGGMGSTGGLTLGFVSEAIVCKVDKKHQESTFDLKIGDNVTVIGRVQGVGYTDIDVEECQVQ